MFTDANTFDASDEVEEQYVKCRCYLRSAPGMWAYYDGYVDVFAPESESEDQVFARAVRQLARTSFPDRPSLDSWLLQRIERLA